MKLWVALYGMIWVVLLEFLLAMKPDPGALLLDLHAALGFVIVGLAYWNSSTLRGTLAPGRLKRVGRATFQLSILMAVLGVLLWANVGTSIPVALGLTVWDALLFLHVVNAIAIITQAAAVAIAFDMWEDREFAKETAPGEVPPPAAPVAGPVPSRR